MEEHCERFSDWIAKPRHLIALEVVKVNVPTVMSACDLHGRELGLNIRL